MASAAGAAATMQPNPAGVASASSPPVRKSQATAIAIVAGVAVLAVGAGLWTAFLRPSAQSPQLTQSPAQPAANATPAPPATTAAPAAAQAVVPVPSSPPGSSSPKSEPGMVTIAAEGLIDPRDPRYGNDKALLQTELRADAKSQLVAKALGLLVEPGSLARNYDVLNSRFLAQSGNYIAAVVEESPPRLGKDGLMSMTTLAVVNVRALQKSLNQMTRDERIELIRAGGDPRISVRITARDADQPGATSQPSPVAENLLKERIKAFGFRTWSDDGDGAAEARQGANFAVQGEVRIRKLSTRLEASGIVVTKYSLASWTVKCVDRETGEEIYFNTTLPKGLGSWASEAEAMKAIGAKVADEFSRNFFLQHVAVSGRRVALVVEGMPQSTPEDVLGRELVGLPAVLAMTRRPGVTARAYELQLAGSAAAGDLVAHGVLRPLNAKLGQPCFTLGRIAGEEVAVVFDGRCADAQILARLESNPPAGLYGAPPARQKAVIKDAETLRRLAI
jgi:serine/threonine-protein kinase